MLLKGKCPENFWMGRIIGRIIDYVHKLPPGNLLFLLFLVWLIPILLIALVMTTFIVYTEGPRWLRDNQIFIVHFTCPILIILIMSGIFAFGLNLLEHSLKFWKRIGELGQFITIFGAYALSGGLAYSLIVKCDDIFGGMPMDDANMAVLLFPSTCIIFIFGILITCLRIFIDILKSRNL